MTDIVVGLQYGDEGKGKVVSFLAKKGEHNFCLRFNGGPNAGHTIYHNNKKYVTHQIPSGIITGMTSIIGDNCYLDINKLKEEIQYLTDLGVNIDEKLLISNKCHLILPEHIEEDKNNNKVGTTCSGIGPVSRNKYFRCGVRVEDNKQLLDFIPSKNIIDVPTYFQNYYINNQNYPSILVEGAQGYGLDINHGEYPYVTSSHCISTDCLNLGIPLSSISKIWGISKIYETYVGARKFQDENDKILKKLQIKGEEYGATTGRPRQCNYLNLDNLIKSAWVNNVTYLVINKCDIFEDIGHFVLLENEQITNFNSFDNMKNYITEKLRLNLPCLQKIIFSNNPNNI